MRRVARGMMCGRDAVLRNFNGLAYQFAAKGTPLKYEKEATGGGCTSERRTRSVRATKGYDGT